LGQFLIVEGGNSGAYLLGIDFGRLHDLFSSRRGQDTLDESRLCCLTCDAADCLFAADQLD